MPVLLDKLGLHQASNIFDDNHIGQLQEVVYALLLWDDIYYLDNSLNHNINFDIDLPIKPIILDETILHDIISSAKTFWREIPIEMRMSSMTQKHLYGAIEYSIIAQQFGYYYMPCLHRSLFLQKLDLSVLNSRKEILTYVDKEIQQFYDEINNKMGKNHISFKSPLLINYLKTISKEGDLIKNALVLRNSIELKNFRSWLDNIDIAISKGDWVMFNSNLNVIDDIISEIKKIDRNITLDCEVSIAFPPAINIPVKLSTRKRHRDGRIFLRNIISHALRNRYL